MKAPGLNVVLFTSTPMGIEVAAAVAALEDVRLLHVVTTSLPKPGTMLPVFASRAIRR